MQVSSAESGKESNLPGINSIVKCSIYLKIYQVQVHQVQDLHTIIEELQQSQVFNLIPGREHISFKNLQVLYNLNLLNILLIGLYLIYLNDYA